MRPDETASLFGRAPAWLRESIREVAAAFGLPSDHVEGVARELADEAVRERFGDTPAAVLAEEISRRRRAADEAASARFRPAPEPAMPEIVPIHRRSREG